MASYCPQGSAWPRSPTFKSLTHLSTHLAGISPTFLPSLETYDPMSINGFTSPKCRQIPSLSRADPRCSLYPGHTPPPFSPLPQFGSPLFLEVLLTLCVPTTALSPTCEPSEGGQVYCPHGLPSTSLAPVQWGCSPCLASLQPPTPSLTCCARS